MKALGAVVGAACLLLVGTVVAGALLAEEERSAFDGGQGRPLIDDADELGMEVARLVSTPHALQSSEGLLAVFDAPRSYSPAEQQAVHAFVAGGGHLLVADTRGHGTQLLPAGLGLERVRLHAPSGMVEATIAGQSLMLSARNATAVQLAPGSEAQIISATSEDAQLDRDGDGIISKSDPLGPFPVLVSAQLGKGTVWVVALPDLFDPVHADAADHEAVRKAILRQIGAPALIVDESRMVSDDPFVAMAGAMVQAAARPPWMYLTLGAAALAGVLAAMRHHGISWHPHRFIPDVFLRRGERPEAAKQATSGWTGRGKVVAGLGPLLALGGMAMGNAQWAWAGALCIAALAVALLQRPPRGQAHRTLRSSRLQERATVPATIQADFSGAIGNLQVREVLHPTMDVPEGRVWGVPTSRHIELAYTLRPSRLGSFDVGPFEAVRQDSLGLRATVAPLAGADRIKVTPLLQDARRTPFTSRVPQILLGGHLVQRSGSGSEFLSLRDYQSGDTMRMVNWKASARSKDLVVNQRVHESPTQLTVLLDVRAISDVGPANATPFVLGARAAASITAGAMQSRDMVRVYLYGDGVHEVAGRGPELQHRFEDALAEMRPSGTTGLMAAVEEAKDALRPGRPVVVVTGAEADDTVEDALHLLRRRGMQPFLVTPPVQAESIQEPVASRDALVKRLRGAGFSAYEIAEGVGLEDVFRIQGAAA